MSHAVGVALHEATAPPEVTARPETTARCDAAALRRATASGTGRTGRARPDAGRGGRPDLNGRIGEVDEHAGTTNEESGWRKH